MVSSHLEPQKHSCHKVEAAVGDFYLLFIQLKNLVDIKIVFFNLSGQQGSRTHDKHNKSPANIFQVSRLVIM